MSSPAVVMSRRRARLALAPIEDGGSLVDLVEEMYAR